MNFRGHLHSAIIILIVFLLIGYPYIKTVMSLTEIIIASLIFLLYSEIPDIDADSNIQTIVYSAILLTDIFLIYIQHYKVSAVIGALSTIPIIAKHRGLCHSWLFGVVISLPFAIVNWLYVIPAIAGFALHKIGDKDYF